MLKQINVIVSSVEVRLISITKLALQITHNGSTIGKQIYGKHITKRRIGFLDEKNVLPVLFC